MNQHELIARARNTDPGTSHGAAKTVKPRQSWEAVLSTAARMLYEKGARDFTQEELTEYAEKNGIPYTPARIRTSVKELETLNVFQKTGDKRKTSHGRWANCYTIQNPNGIDEYVKNKKEKK